MLSRFLTTREQWVLGGVAVAVLVGSAVLVGRAWFAEPSAAAEPVVEVAAPRHPAGASPSAIPAARPGAPEEECVVAIDGAIRQPGVYDMRPGDRLHDLIDEAGGLAPAADTSTLNLAARLIDGTTVTIPAAGISGNGARVRNLAAYLRFTDPSQPATAGMAGSASASGGSPALSPGAAPSAAGLVNINTASRQQLETLPGIGPVTAGKIIAYRTSRPFRTVDDLMGVSGIGEKKLAALRPLVTVR